MRTKAPVERLSLDAIQEAHHKPGLEPEYRYLISIHALASLGEESLLESLIHMALDEGINIDSLREILLQTHLFCGFPRTINAFSRLNRCLSMRDGKGAKKMKYIRDESPPQRWRSRGEVLFKRIYLKNHSEVLESLRNFHPELSEWILNDAYGKVLSREVLKPKIRELAAIGTLTVLRVFPQLLSHIKGGLHLGANQDEVKEAILQMRLYTTRKTISHALRLFMMGTRSIPKS